MVKTKAKKLAQKPDLKHPVVAPKPAKAAPEKAPKAVAPKDAPKVASKIAPKAVSKAVLLDAKGKPVVAEHMTEEQMAEAHARAVTFATADNASHISHFKSQSGVDLTEKVKELVRLAQEQGYLTYGDINDVLPESVVNPDELDDIYTRLRTLEIEIVDQAEVDRVKQPEPEEE